VGGRERAVVQDALRARGIWARARVGSSGATSEKETAGHEAGMWFQGITSVRGREFPRPPT
jgi:hypothetical protein